MTFKKMIGSLGAVISVLLLTTGILVFIHTVVSDRLDRAEYSVPEEVMLSMTSGVTLQSLDEMDSADGIVRKYAALDEKNEAVGYAFEALSGGLDGDVRIYISFDEDYLIQHIHVLETAGLPVNLGYLAASEEYLNQYTGAASVTTDAKSITGTLIHSLEGADYSCQGVYSCVTAAFRQLDIIRAALAETEVTGNEN